MIRTAIVAAALVAVPSTAPLAAQADTTAAHAEITATAELTDSAGRRVGEVTLRETPGSGVILEIQLRGLAEGVHAIHIHETGRCEPPTFDSAGGHFAPRDNDHGLLHSAGTHAGDLLNLQVPASGELRTERLATAVTLREGEPNSLFDADGSAIIIHAGEDDYRSQPSGDAGDPIVCGVIRPTG
jgi:superoxide dismutase, Cu-Zn family